MHPAANVNQGANGRKGLDANFHAASLLLRAVRLSLHSVGSSSVPEPSAATDAAARIAGDRFGQAAAVRAALRS